MTPALDIAVLVRHARARHAWLVENRKPLTAESEATARDLWLEMNYAEQELDRMLLGAEATR